MSTNAEPSTNSRIDLTMMYATHNAFRRDLTLLVSASDGTQNWAAYKAGWQTFKNYLTIHHTAEDVALWPIMRKKLANRPDDLRLLEEMEAEHAELDPMMDAVDTAIAESNRLRLREYTEDLSTTLLGHLDHEEAEALPLLQSVLTPEEWASFGAEQRRNVGIKGGPAFFPWLLDGAPEATQRRVLGLLPAPLRLIYRAVWRPRYVRQSPWKLARA
ncbi:hemerythrin domain-containing protein [Streptantibioticus rubrisoli]|uniref:Hemerythrin domain-containing protein n=1 Tax=Streptantibioticus rubrisoli TaxID=1387313 RepID=A0ABT1PGL6_9ACTN|nr:hemerythrin domain-containing protein [Streptantibioticus rubrisoli]MCQ4044517.1 hemerythrin domain-containing protein [Streptantibioticus rubrisoli]